MNGTKAIMVNDICRPMIYNLLSIDTNERKYFLQRRLHIEPMLKKTLRSPQAGFVLIDVDSCLGGVIIF
jgi:hypothetical protein